MEDDSYLVQKLEKIDSTLTNVLIEQGRINEKFSSQVESSKNEIKRVSDKLVEVDDLDNRLTRTEGAILILKWVVGIASGIIIGVTVKVISDVLGA